jgi:hypothetical protein
MPPLLLLLPLLLPLLLTNLQLTVLVNARLRGLRVGHPAAALHHHQQQQQRQQQCLPPV